MFHEKEPECNQYHTLNKNWDKGGGAMLQFGGKKPTAVQLQVNELSNGVESIRMPKLKQSIWSGPFKGFHVSGSTGNAVAITCDDTLSKAC